jgi:hypothetical protein
MHHKLSNKGIPKRIFHGVRNLRRDERINQGRTHLRSLFFVLPNKYVGVWQASLLKLYSMQDWKQKA